MTYRQAVQEAEASGKPTENTTIESVLIKKTSGILINPNDRIIDVRGGSVTNIGHDKSVLVVEGAATGPIEWPHREDRKGQLYPNGTWYSYDRRAPVFVSKPHI